VGRDGTNLGLGIRMGCISSQASIVELRIYLTLSQNFFLFFFKIFFSSPEKNFFPSYLLSINIEENSIEKNINTFVNRDAYESIAIASS
jgi:hypothetical protein